MLCGAFIHPDFRDFADHSSPSGGRSLRIREAPNDLDGFYQVITNLHYDMLYFSFFGNKFNEVGV